MSSDKFIFFLGFGFLFTAILGISFEIHPALIFGFSVFAFIITMSEFFAISDDDKELKVLGKKTIKIFNIIRGLIIASSIPVSLGLPLVINELFAFPTEAFSRLSSYITISSIGMILIMRKN